MFELEPVPPPAVASAQPRTYLFPQLIAARFAHGRPFRVRYRGRLLFEQGAVHDVSLVLDKLSGWIDDPQEGLIGCAVVVGSVDDETLGVRPDCACRTFPDGAFCHHLYAVMLAYDRELLGKGFDAANDPQDIQQMLAHRLWREDHGLKQPPLQMLSMETIRVEQAVHRIAASWAKPRTDDDYADYAEPVQRSRDRAGGIDPRSRDALRLKGLEAAYRDEPQAHLQRLTRIHYLVEPDGEQVVVTLKGCGSRIEQA